MIYEAVSEDEPICQGDLFTNLPRVDFSLSNLPVLLDDTGATQVSWIDRAQQETSLTAVVAMKPVRAIVVTQNCDAVRGQYISLCQVDDFLTSTGKKDTPPKTTNKWQRLIVETARTNPRLFYLPPSPEFGLQAAQAADFRVLIRLSRLDLEALRGQRLCRLKEVASEHFREALGNFFRRYAYNEWYPLSRDQFEAYSSDKQEPVDPYPWQE